MSSSSGLLSLLLITSENKVLYVKHQGSGYWLQEAISSKVGGTAFNTVVDGQRTLQSGDALRLATKPVLVGRALYFVVGQVSAANTHLTHSLAVAAYTEYWSHRSQLLA